MRVIGVTEVNNLIKKENENETIVSQLIRIDGSNH